MLWRSFINATFPYPLPCSLITGCLMQSVNGLLYLMCRDKPHASTRLMLHRMDSVQTFSFSPTALRMVVGWGGVKPKQINKSSWERSTGQIGEGLETSHQSVQAKRRRWEVSVWAWVVEKWGTSESGLDSGVLQKSKGSGPPADRFSFVNPEAFAARNVGKKPGIFVSGHRSDPGR